MNIRYLSWFKGFVWVVEFYYMRVIYGCSWSNIESDLVLFFIRKYIVILVLFVRFIVNVFIEILSSLFFIVIGFCVNVNKGKLRFFLYRFFLVVDKIEY